jgi:HEPN domain-containing protein
MTPLEDAKYRMKLAKEHAEDGFFELEHGRWSKAALSAQLSVGNSAKALIGLFGPVAKIHDLAGALLELITGDLNDEEKKMVERLAELTEKFGVKEHVLASYGDEVALRTPREIYDQSKAERAIEMAREAAGIAGKLIEVLPSKKNKES